MRMKDLAHTRIDQLSLLELHVAPWSKPADHQYVTPPKPVERFVYVIRGKCRFFLENKELCAGEKEMVYLPGETAYRSHWLEDSEFMVIDLLLHNDQGQPIRFGDSPEILFRDTHGTYRGLLEELAAKSDAHGPLTGWNGCHCPLSFCAKWPEIPTARSWMPKPGRSSRH